MMSRIVSSAASCAEEEVLRPIRNYFKKQTLRPHTTLLTLTRRSPEIARMEARFGCARHCILRFFFASVPTTIATSRSLRPHPRPGGAEDPESVKGLAQECRRKADLGSRETRPRSGLDQAAHQGCFHLARPLLPSDIPRASIPARATLRQRARSPCSTIGPPVCRVWMDG